MMKKLILAAVLAAAFGSPAFAQSYTPEFGTANVVSDVSSQQGTSAYAQARPAIDRAPRMSHQGGIFDGAPAGVDPYAYHQHLMATEGD